MLLCSLMKKKTGSVFPAFCRATNFHHALIMCRNVSQRGTIAQMYHEWVMHGLLLRMNGMHRMHLNPEHLDLLSLII